MCGRFSQSMTREDYLALIAEEAERDIPFDPEPIGRYNVAPGTKVLLLNERDEQLHLDPVYWDYAPGWWDKPPLINARVETAATSRMFKPLWQHDRAICFAYGCFPSGPHLGFARIRSLIAPQHLIRGFSCHHWE
jgi:Uncharacterized conserved protein